MMKPYSLYSEEVWENFCKKNGENKKSFEVKKYPQFDPYCNFFDHQDKIQKLVADPTLKSVASYSFTPFVKILTKTPRYKYQESEEVYCLETKVRPISFASHFDSFIYGFYSYALNKKYEDFIKAKGFDKCIFAYRTDLEGKCNIQFAKEVFDQVREKLAKNGECVAVALDITGYFDSIEHARLKENWCKILNLEGLPEDQYKVFKSLTKYSYVSYNSFLKKFKVDLKKIKKEKIKWNSLLDLIPNSTAGDTYKAKLNLVNKLNLIETNKSKRVNLNNKIELQNRGIPQGSAMSSVLSNIYLIDFDKWLNNLSHERFEYRRYCDDILIICGINDVDWITNEIITEISKYGLKIKKEKTEIIKFQHNSKGKFRAFNLQKINKCKTGLIPANEKLYLKNLQYLGFEFNGENIYIRPGSLSRYFRKMKGRIVKTVMMAYSDKSEKDKILKKQIFERYSYIGKRNFISYALKAASKEYRNSKGKIQPGMDSSSIRKQVSSHFNILENEIEKTSYQRYLQKKSKELKKASLGKRAKSKFLKY